VEDARLTRPDGRVVAFIDFGPPAGTPVIWCHGGPGSRFEPEFVAAQAADFGLRAVGIDRPGYGRSSPLPGRTISAWIGDALGVADRLGLGGFFTVGESTGGAYALALAALAPERVIGAVVCAGVTDMRCPECRATMSTRHAHAVWDAGDRSAAIAAAEEAHGRHGSLLPAMVAVLPPSDLTLFSDRSWQEAAHLAEMFAQGLEGYADDRLADGGGWVDFDVKTITCPVIVVHGDADPLCDVRHAYHTASLISGSELRIVPGGGHFSVVSEAVAALGQLASSQGRR
jgi:pimeloyl-ACP methyl ester carboxylesterase